MVVWWWSGREGGFIQVDFRVEGKILFPVNLFCKYRNKIHFFRQRWRSSSPLRRLGPYVLNQMRRMLVNPHMLCSLAYFIWLIPFLPLYVDRQIRLFKERPGAALFITTCNRLANRSIDRFQLINLVVQMLNAYQSFENRLGLARYSPAQPGLAQSIDAYL